MSSGGGSGPERTPVLSCFCPLRSHRALPLSQGGCGDCMGHGQRHSLSCKQLLVGTVSWTLPLAAAQEA